MENNQVTQEPSDEENKQKFEQDRYVHITVGNHCFKFRQQNGYLPKLGNTIVVCVLIVDVDRGWRDVSVEECFDDALDTAKQYSKALSYQEAKAFNINFDQERAFKESVKSFLDGKVNYEFLERVFKKSFLSALYWREGVTAAGSVLKDEVVKAIKDGTAAAMASVNK